MSREFYDDERDFEDGGVFYDNFDDFIDDDDDERDWEAGGLHYDGPDDVLDDDDARDVERYVDDDFDDEDHDAFAFPEDDYDDMDGYIEPAPRRQTYQAPLRRGRPSLTPLRMPTYDAVRRRNRGNDS